MKTFQQGDCLIKDKTVSSLVSRMQLTDLVKGWVKIVRKSWFRRRRGEHLRSESRRKFQKRLPAATAMVCSFQMSVMLKISFPISFQTCIAGMPFFPLKSAFHVSYRTRSGRLSRVCLQHTAAPLVPIKYVIKRLGFQGRDYLL